MSKYITSKLKKFYNRHDMAIIAIIVIFCVIVNLVSSFFITFKFFQKPITNEQVEFFKEVAYDVYHQGANVLNECELPYDVNLILTSNKITVRSTSNFSSGAVIAIVENNTLTFEHDTETVWTIMLSILIGIIICMIEVLFASFCLEIHNIKRFKI